MTFWAMVWLAIKVLVVIGVAYLAIQLAIGLFVLVLAVIKAALSR